MRWFAALVFLALVAAGGVYGWWSWRTARSQADGALVLYGNVEIRQVDLAFGVDGPIAEVLVDEGDYVEAGRTLAVLDQDAFRYSEASAAAALRNAEARLAELIAGSRPEEVEQAKAKVFSAEASLEHATVELNREEQLVRTKTSSQHRLDAARVAQRTAEAALRVARADLNLRTEGTRQEQLTQQRAAVEASRANLELQRYRLERATLKAPDAGIVLTRIREPGAVVMANTPVLTVSVINPVWIRAYVDEPNLGQVAPGTTVEVTTDAVPSKIYAGRIGYVSPTAEFTPKTVETPKLRTALVYRVRVIVANPNRALRQGMPATVTIGATPETKP
jgi:HlyD family secretion protein